MTEFDTLWPAILDVGRNAGSGGYRRYALNAKAEAVRRPERHRLRHATPEADDFRHHLLADARLQRDTIANRDVMG